jgi:hypothetical protein
MPGETPVMAAYIRKNAKHLSSSTQQFASAYEASGQLRLKYDT